jgi:hypothetical protein
MSRKLLTAAALAAFALPAATARAQAGLGLAAGLSLPKGDFGKVTDAGYHVTGLIGIRAATAPVGLRLDGSFSEFNYKASLGGRSGAKARLLYATANVVLTSSGNSAPYVIGGFGIYHATAVCDVCTTSSTKGGFNGGVGYRFALTGFSAFLEARYHYITGASDPTNGGVKSSSTQFIPISFGVRF